MHDLQLNCGKVYTGASWVTPCLHYQAEMSLEAQLVVKVTCALQATEANVRLRNNKKGDDESGSLMYHFSQTTNHRMETLKRMHNIKQESLSRAISKRSTDLI